MDIELRIRIGTRKVSDTGMVTWTKDSVTHTELLTTTSNEPKLIGNMIMDTVISMFGNTIRKLEALADGE